MAWIAAWALAGLSNETKPVKKKTTERVVENRK